MSQETTPPVPRVTVVHAEACHFCEDAYRALTEIAEQHPLDIQMVPADSAPGRDLFRQHRPAMYPLILVDDEYFSAGRLPRKKLLATLGARARGRAAATAGKA